MTALFAKLESPVVTGIEFDWNGENVQHWPEQVPDLYLGEPIVIVAKLNHLSGRVQVHGQRGTTPWKLNFTLKGGRTESGIDRLFARRKIASLTASIAGGADARLVRTQIVELGLAHHLVTQHTSLVAIEQTASRPDGTPLNTSPLPTNLPKGWIYDSVFQEMNQPVIRDQDADNYYQIQSASKKSYSRSVASSTTSASSAITQLRKEKRRQLEMSNLSASSAITQRRKMEKAQIAAKSKPSVNASQISNDKRATTKSSTATAPSKTTVAISNQDTQRHLPPTQTKPSANTPRRYTTGQPTVLAKLQEIAGVLPQTATPTQLLFLVGLVLLLMAAWFRLRTARI
jgi:LPXTG-motif cell wall-anchored protein